MVDRADINSVLQQMRAMQGMAQQGVAGVEMPAANSLNANAVGKTEFSDLLKDAVNKVAEVQGDAKKMATAFEKGDPTVDLPQVMISMEKASVSFQALTQVRNRLVTAYEDVMKMPI